MIAIHSVSPFPIRFARKLMIAIQFAHVVHHIPLSHLFETPKHLKVTPTITAAAAAAAPVAAAAAPPHVLSSLLASLQCEPASPGEDIGEDTPDSPRIEMPLLQSSATKPGDWPPMPDSPQSPRPQAPVPCHPPASTPGCLTSRRR